MELERAVQQADRERQEAETALQGDGELYSTSAPAAMSMNDFMPLHARSMRRPSGASLLLTLTRDANKIWCTDTVAFDLAQAEQNRRMIRAESSAMADAAYGQERGAQSFR